MEARAGSALPPSWAPYGFMNQGLEDEADHSSQPRAWHGPDFIPWVDGLVGRLAAFAWPQWTANGWDGAAGGNAEALTRADLAIMSRCAAQLVQPARHAGGRSNMWWFNWEDDLPGNSWDRRFEACFPTSQIDRDTFRMTLGEIAMNRYYGGIPFMLKRGLQRPRPYQMALALGTDRIAPQPSISAWSPSAISGHSFQALMGVLTTYLDFSALAPHRDELLRLAVDIGDRRVLAGIHYPSDNAMSWWVAFNCIEHVARDKAQEAEMRKFIREAVAGSRVWAAMEKSAAHKPLVDELNTLLTGN